MANYVNQVTGHPTVIQMGYGVPTSTVKPGSMAIVTYQGLTAEHDEATAKLRTDEGYPRRMASANDYFDMGSFFNISDAQANLKKFAEKRVSCVIGHSLHVS